MRRSFLALALISLCSIAMRVSAHIGETVDRALRFMVDVLATKPSVLQGNGGFTGLLVNRPAYDGPPIHELRHEAGTSRRSAARNV